MILDVIIIAFVLIAVFIGWKLKASRMLLALVGNIIAVIASAFFGDYLSKIVYDSYIKDKIIESLTLSMEPSMESITEAFERLPLLVRFALNITGYSPDNGLSSVTSDITQSLATNVESAVSSVVISVLSVILSILIFAVVYLLYRFLIMHFLLKVFELPLIKGVDSFLGSLCAIVVTAVLVSFFAFILRMITPYVTDMPFWLSESTIYNSYIFYHFYSGNIFYNIISLF